ncbi:hypothetical protein CCHR01_17326 [Colletotrichum chrysophilum]|uniref:Uncharacterized protein n=1 Tax=Colletotrichum chrysophilum TaxID=1836956 RepID=A0AAD9E6Z6_9PEZI|nr:hypothetical protein CCHR01_17326 [Colletotrichum chrysophilum]
MGERTGSRVFQWVWSYVGAFHMIVSHIPRKTSEMMPISCCVHDARRHCISILTGSSDWPIVL